MNDELREAVRQWRAKAESDWKTIEILIENEEAPQDIICFHCQQFVEKLLKALLTARGIEAPKTHDLRRLIQLIAPFAPELGIFSDRVDLLTMHGVQSRYPDDYREISRAEARKMMELAKELGSQVINIIERSD